MRMRQARNIIEDFKKIFFLLFCILKRRISVETFFLFFFSKHEIFAEIYFAFTKLYPRRLIYKIEKMNLKTPEEILDYIDEMSNFENVEVLSKLHTVILNF